MEFNYREPVTKNLFNYGLFMGARERCAELGYALEEFMLADVGMSLKRLSSVLYARNIQGVFMGPQQRKISHISTRNFAWERFSTLTFGFSQVSPAIDMVIDAQYRSARLAVRKLRALGYKRIGVLVDNGMNNRTDGNFLAGYVSESLRFAPSMPIPPLICYGKNWEPECREWLRRYKPDAVYDPVCVLTRTLPPDEWCAYGVAIDGVNPLEPPLAGVVKDEHLLGRVGVDELVSMIRSDRRGIPANPRRILIEGYWKDGRSAPRVN